MIPVYQTIFGAPDGNCFQACIASVLELPLDDVPHFCKGDNPHWMRDTLDFLRPVGLSLLTVHLPEGLDAEDLPDAWCVLSGPGPRGHRHSVVGRGGMMVHDPHPDGTGLLAVEEYDLFVAIDPATVARMPLLESR